MLRPLIALLIAAPLGMAEEPKKAAPPPVVGLWLGTLTAGPTKLRIAFEIGSHKDDGKLAAKMISIDQLGTVVPCKDVTFAEGTLTIAMPSIAAKFAGTLDETKDKITGEFTQGKAPLPLVLDRIEKLPEANRPQHPKPPYPYRVEDVTFENAGAKVELAGTLTLPKGDGPFTAVVLVTGSGPQDRDETIMEHKPFLVIADHLTRAGYAVLRYDDRGVGKSKGTFAGCTSADFATDAHAAVKFLLTRKEIDPRRVGICGHSEGGLIGPMIAADHPNDVAFLILLAGPGVTGGEILKTQNLDILREGKMAEKGVSAVAEFFDAALPLVAGDLRADELTKAVRTKADEALKKLDDEELRVPAKVRLDALTAAFAEPWMRYFLVYDPAPSLQKVKCPTLALNGAKDIQVRAKENLAAVAAAMKAGGNAKLTSIELPGLNHLFQACTTGSVMEYARIEETINPAALKAMTEWLAALGK